MPELFHNPYHFVPVKKREDFTHYVTTEDARKGKWGHHDHDRYRDAQTYSGRLICRLETVSPIVIGAEQLEGTAPKEVKPFELDGEPAIPASTLRGLLSSIAEAASNSALRVLDCERTLSYRRGMRDGNLSAMGMIVVEKDESGKERYKLRPLALPTMNKNGANTYKLPVKFLSEDCNYAPFFQAFKKPPLKVLVDANNIESFTWEKQNFYYMKLSNTLSYDAANGSVAAHDKLKFSSKDKDATKLIGQKLLDTKVYTQAEYDQIGDKSDFQRGIVRVLRGPGRSDIPGGKSHETFLPYPNDIEKDIPSFPIPDKVVEEFEKLADERTEEKPQLPYEPVGTKRNLTNDPTDDRVRLKHGDIVYFVPNAKGTEVAEISFSSIWRGYSKTVGEYFDSESHPFNAKRKKISPAELLFGFAQEEKKKIPENHMTAGPTESAEDRHDDPITALSFKGKVRVSFGRLTGWEGDDQHYYDEVPLKILSSPKPPSPALYFKKKDAPFDYISKASLNNALHEPQGRKVYLHRHDKTGTPWKSLNNDPDLDKQKNLVRPLKEKRRFHFHIDFDNLTAWELGLLCFAVKPFQKFHHKIGMGKPIGLGTIKIEPVGLFCVDRRQRYTSHGLFTPRYHYAWMPEGDAGALPAGLYARESQSPIPGKAEFSYDVFRKIFLSDIDKDIKQALWLLGDPEKVTHPVHTPLLAGIVAEYTEKETFKWFVANDSGTGNSDNGTKLPEQKDYLVPLPQTPDELPTLRRHLAAKNDKLIFFLGGNDLEMETIRGILQNHRLGIHDNNLTWGARASSYADQINECIQLRKTPVLVELKFDLQLNRRKCVFIDHHGPSAGKDAPTSLHQVFGLLGLPSTEWTRWFDLVAANDRGYVKEMMKIGATTEEMQKVRELDRRAQGITPEQEAKGEEAVKAAAVVAGGKLTVVHLPHSRTAVVTDRMEPALGGRGYENLLVISPGEVNFYGAGEAVDALNKQFPGGWSGGSLPDYGFWGHGRPVPDVLDFLERFFGKNG